MANIDETPTAGNEKITASITILTPDQESEIQQLLATGRYRSAEHVISAALHLLTVEDHETERRLSLLGGFQTMGNVLKKLVKR